MAGNGLGPVHPGLVLREELEERGVAASTLAEAIDVPVSRVTAIIDGERGITADTAVRLGRYFDTTAQFWLNLQRAWQASKRVTEAIAALREQRKGLSLEGLDWRELRDAGRR